MSRLYAYGLVSVAAVLAAVFLASAASAEALPDESPAQAAFGVEALVGSAIATHPTVAMKRLEQSAAGSLVTAARLQFFPTPAVTVDTLQGKQATVFRLSQPLWSGGRLTADLTSAQLKQARAEVAVNDAATTLALRVVTLYQQFYLQSGRIASQRRGVDKLEQLVTMIDRRTASGISAQIDLDLARARLAQARSDLIALLSSQQTALSQLSQVVGRPLQVQDVAVESVAAAMRDAWPGVDASAIESKADTQKADAIDAPASAAATGADPAVVDSNIETLPSLLERALAVSPTLRLASIDAQLARTEVDQTRALLWPTVSVRAERQEGSYTGSLAPGGRVYFSFQYTPGAGASVIPQAAAAEVRAQAADQVILASKRDLSDHVEAEWLDLRSAASRISELERTRVGSSDVLDSSFRLFVTGRRTWLDLLNSVRELMQTEQLEVDARATAVGASYRLSLLAGQPFWSRDGVNP